MDIQQEQDQERRSYIRSRVYGLRLDEPLFELLTACRLKGMNARAFNDQMKRCMWGYLNDFRKVKRLRQLPSLESLMSDSVNTDADKGDRIPFALKQVSSDDNSRFIQIQTKGYLNLPQGQVNTASEGQSEPDSEQEEDTGEPDEAEG